MSGLIGESSVSVIGSKWWNELDGLDQTIEGDVK